MPVIGNWHGMKEKHETVVEDWNPCKHEFKPSRQHTLLYLG